MCRALRHARQPPAGFRPAATVARDMPHVPLEDALRLVYLYAEKESPKYERAAMKFLRRYLDERRRRFRNVSKVVRSLEERGIRVG